MICCLLFELLICCLFTLILWLFRLCLVSMGTLLLGKVKPLTNEPNLPSTFCSAAGWEGIRVSKVTDWSHKHAQPHAHTHTLTCTCTGTHGNSFYNMPCVWISKYLTASFIVSVWYNKGIKQRKEIKLPYTLKKYNFFFMNIFFQNICIMSLFTLWHTHIHSHTKFLNPIVTQNSDIINT